MELSKKEGRYIKMKRIIVCILCVMTLLMTSCSAVKKIVPQPKKNSTGTAEAKADEDKKSLEDKMKDKADKLAKGLEQKLGDVLDNKANDDSANDNSASNDASGSGASAQKFDKVDIAAGNSSQIDLDFDGSEEKVELTFKSESDEEYSSKDYYLHINGDRVVEQVGNAIEGSLSIVDIDTSDKYKEIIFIAGYENGYTAITVYHYINGELVEVMLSDNGDSISYFNITECNGDGTILIPGESNFGYFDENEEYEQGKDLGQYEIKCKYILADGYLARLGNERYNETTDEWRDRKYIVKFDEIPVYEKYKEAKEAFKLKKGDVFHLLAVRKFEPVYSTNYADMVYSEAWVLIKTDDGKQGWFNVPKGHFYESPDGYIYHWG